MPIRLRRVYDAALVVLVDRSSSPRARRATRRTPPAPAAAPCTPSDSPTITFLAYSTPQEVYDAKIIPAFKSMWKDEHDGQNLNFLESYGGSTTQAQNVVNGQPADVVALSLAPDVDTIEDAGLITHDWTDAPDGGMVSSSVVVFDVRPGNPKGIKDWNDLAKSGTQVLTPDPAQSGGARWNLVSLWGSALRGDVPGIAKDDESARHQADARRDRQRDRLRQLGARARSRTSRTATATSRSPTRTRSRPRRRPAATDEAVYPKGSILIENPVAVVDKNAEKDCVA